MDVTEDQQLGRGWRDRDRGPDTMIVQKCTAKFAFEARSEKELSFKEGDIIVVETKMNSGWWIGELDGKVGLFPVNYTEVGPEEQVDKYKPIKLRTQPSTSIAELQKQCGLISEKKELTKLQRQKISSKITDLQNKMQATINRSLAAQQAAPTGHSAAAAPPQRASDSYRADSGEAGEVDTLVTVLKARPAGPRGRRAMSRGHLSTLKRGNAVDASKKPTPSNATLSSGDGEAPTSMVATKEVAVSSAAPSEAPLVSQADKIAAKQSGEQPEPEMQVKEGAGESSTDEVDTGACSVEEKKKKSKKKKVGTTTEMDEKGDSSTKKKKKSTKVKSKTVDYSVDEPAADTDDSKPKKKKKSKLDGDDEKEKEKRKSKRKSRVIMDDTVTAEEARRAVRQQQQESTRSKHKRSPSTSTLVGLSEGKDKRIDSEKKEEKKLRRTVSIQDVGDQLVDDDTSSSDKKKSKTKEIRELTRKLRAESKLRTALQESSLDLQKEITELRAANAQLVEQQKTASSSEKAAGADAVSRLEGEKAVLEAERVALAGEAKQLREKAHEEEDRAQLAEEEVSTLSKEMKKLRKNHATEVESLKIKIVSAESLAEEKSKKASGLRKEVGELAARASDLEESVAFKARELATASESLARLTAKNKELSLDCSKLRDSIQRMTAEQTFGAKSLQLMTTKLESLEGERDRYRSEKELVENQLAEALSRICSLEESAKATAAAAAATAAGALAAAETRCKSLSVTVAAKEDLVAELEAKLAKASAAAEEERTSLEQQLVVVSKQVKSLENSEKKTSGELAIALAELDQLRSSNAKLSEKAERLVSQLRSAQESYEAKVGELESTLEQETAARQASERQIGVLRQEAAGERSAVESEAELQLNELRSQLATSRAQVEDLTSKLAVERSRIAALEGERETEREQLEAEHAAAISAVLAKHEDTLADARKKFAAEIASKDQELAEERNTQDSISEELKSSEAMVAELKEAVIGLKQSLLAAEGAAEEGKRAAEAVKREAEAAVTQATAAEKLARCHEAAAAAAEARVKELSEQLRRGQDEHSSLLVEKERELAAQFSQEASVEVQQLRAEVLDLKEAANVTARQLEGAQDSVAGLQQKLERERSAHVTQLDEEKSELLSQHLVEVERLQSRLAETDAAFEAATDSHKSELALANAALGESMAAITTLKDQLADAHEEYRAVTADVERLKSESAAAQDETEVNTALGEENEILRNRIGELEKSVEEYKVASAQHEKKAAANRRRFDEILDLQKDVKSLEEELESKDAKIARLKAEHSLTVASMQAQIDELGTEGRSPARAEGEGIHTQVKDLRTRLKEASEKLEAEKGIRDQLQTRLRSAETELSTLQRSVREGEAEASRLQASRLEELSSTPASTKSVKRLVEQKHLLEDKVLTLTKKLSEQEDAQGELELAFSDRLNSLISTIDEENEKRANAEKKHKKTLARLDEAEMKLIEEAQAKRGLEMKIEELTAIQVKLEQELLEEAEVQNSLKEAFAVKLDEFCQTLDQMYDKQMEIQGEKDQLAAAVESLEGKILEETKARMAAQAELRDEVEVRQELESTFIDKLEKLSLLVMQEANASSYEDLQNDE